MDDKLSEIVEGEQPAQLRLHPERARHQEYARRFSAGDGTMRRKLRLIFEDSAEYLFLRTVANPDAMAEVPKHQEELRKARGVTHDDCWFSFDERLNDLYHETLDHLAQKQGLVHVRYAMVQKGGGYWDGRHGEEPSWPQIHVLKGGEAEKARFTHALDALHSQEAYAFIQSKEAPQNYELGEVNLLRRLKIAPLVMQDRTWSVKGSELKNALDFLAPLGIHYSSPSTGGCYDD